MNTNRAVLKNMILCGTAPAGGCSPSKGAAVTKTLCLLFLLCRSWQHFALSCTLTFSEELIKWFSYLELQYVVNLHHGHRKNRHKLCIWKQELIYLDGHNESASQQQHLFFVLFQLCNIQHILLMTFHYKTFSWNSHWTPGHPWGTIPL